MTVDAPTDRRARAGAHRTRVPRIDPRRVAWAATLVGLAAVTALLRHHPLGASSLWLDDAWVALATRVDSLGDLRLVGLTAPGFSLLLAGWLTLMNGSATAAQLLPYLFAVAAPPALAAVVALRTRGGGGSPLVAVLAGALLAVAPMGIHFATRVKQYSLDALLAVVLLGLGWWLAERPAAERRWAWLTGVAVLAMVLTAATVPVVIGAFAAGGIAAWRRGAATRRVALVATVAFAVVGGAWWATVLRPAVNEALRTYWAGHYLFVDDGWLAAVGDVPRVLGDVLSAASPLPVWASGLLLAAGVGWLSVRRPIVAALVVVPIGVGLVLAALHVAPLGGGRTDHHLFPGVALAMAFALEPAWRARRTVAVGAAVALVTAAAVTTPTARAYPEQDLRPLVERLDDELALDDTVVVYPSAVWAYALYTDLPVDVVADPDSIWRWRPEILDPRVEVLAPHRDVPERYAPEVRVAVADTSGSVWLVASHYRGDIRVIEASLRAEGFTPVDEWRRPGARVTRWDR